AALDGVPVGARADRRRARGDALLRPRPRAGVRPPLSARRGAAPVRRLVLAFALLALAVPAAAVAHATLKSATPGFGKELQSAPKVVTLTFDQFVKFPSVEVLDVHGRNYALPARAVALTVTARVRPLPTGAYTIRWHALSADSHVVSGVWTFGVR